MISCLIISILARTKAEPPVVLTEKNKVTVNQSDILVTETSFLVNLDVSGFTNVNGKVLRYAVWIKEHRLDNELKPPLQAISWTSVSKIYYCRFGL